MRLRPPESVAVVVLRDQKSPYVSTFLSFFSFLFIPTASSSFPICTYPCIKFGEGYYMDQQVQEDFKIPRVSSMDEFLNALYSKEPLKFDGQDMEITNHELDLLQSSGANNQVQFTVDAGSKESNISNNGYCDYNNGEDLVLSDATGQMELNMGTSYNQNFEVLDKEFGITYAPIDMTHAPVLQSQSFVANYEELAFDASILDVVFEGCTLEDCPELSTYAYSNMENDKRGKTSTLSKQNLVADSPLTNESHGALSNEERRRFYNRQSARRSRAKRKRLINELEALEKLFNEVKPLLRNILIADSGSFIYEAKLFQKQLKEFIFKNQNASIAFGVSTSTGFNHTGEVVGAKIK